MNNFFRSILGGGATDTDGDPAELRGELQTLRLDYAEARKTIALLERDVEREREGSGLKAEEVARSRAASLAEDVAVPISQLLAQQHLFESGTDVAAEDVLAAAGGLVRACLRQGLEMIGEAGAETAFDPALHMTLSGKGPAKGDPVIVRFPGLSVDGKVTRKAGVEAC